MSRVPPESRVTHLVVARESDTKDIPLLEGMILQTLERNPHLPGVRRLIDLGVRPVSHPEEVAAQKLEALDSKAVLFSIEGTACLYSRGSAAKDDNAAKENGFVKLFCKVIDEHRPEHIYVATFSRLVRSFYQASPVQNAIQRAGSTVHYSEGPPINFSDPEGPMRWAMMAAFADMERNAVVSRLMLGRVGKHRQGKWVAGSYGIPMGYDTDANEKLVVVPEAAAAVHKAIRLMSDPEISNSELAMALGAVGVVPPARAGRSSWQYSNWTWDGTPYVPRARRDPNEAAHLWTPDRPEDAVGGQPQTLAQYSSPDVVGRRFVGMLDTWETGELMYAVQNPLPNVRRYAEYAVVENAAGDGEVLFHYSPGLPEGGWATAEEFAQARAVRTQRAALEAQKALSRGAQLPLLGNLGRWNVDGYRYGFVSGRVSNKNRYALSRMKLPAVLPMDSEGRPVYPGFVHGGRNQGERIALIDAGDIHRELAAALIRAIEDGVEVRPHSIWPPTRMAPISEDRMAEMTRAKTGLEARAQRARALVLDGSASPAMQAQLMADAERILTQAAAMQAELDAAAAQTAVAFPDELSSRPIEIVRALAALAELDGQAPRHVTQLVNTVLTNLRVEPDGTQVRCSVEALLDVEDGLVVLGPVSFTVPQRLAATARRFERGARDAASTEIAAQDAARVEQSLAERKRDLAEALLTTDASAADLANSHSRGGSGTFKLASDFLVAAGMTRSWANMALRVTPLVTRQTIWACATDAPPPDGVSAAFGRRIHDTFFNQDRRVTLWWKRTQYRKEFLDWLRQNDRQVTVEGARRWLARQTSSKFAWDRIITPPQETGRGSRDNTVMLPVVRAPRMQDRVACRPDCRPRCRDHRVVKLTRCPHPDCIGDLDYHVPVQEIPTGLLCGSCMREPVEGSPVFPDVYRRLTVEEVERRVEAVDPSTARTNRVSAASRTMRDAARRWAVSQGLHDGGPSLVTLEQINAYLAAVADGSILDNTAIRQWARENNLTVNERGRIPDTVLTAYRRDLARRVPQTTREWARSRGMSTPQLTELTGEIVEAFATYRNPSSE